MPSGTHALSGSTSPEKLLEVVCVRAWVRVCVCARALAHTHKGVWGGRAVKGMGI